MINTGRINRRFSVAPMLEGTDKNIYLLQIKILAYIFIFHTDYNRTDFVFKPIFTQKFVIFNFGSII